MDCRLVVNSLSNYLDGSLLEAEVRLLEIHLAECPPCNIVRLELAEIRSAARELPLHTPQRALWKRIQLSIEVGESQQGKGREAIEQPGRWSRLMSRHFTFTLPQLAGAGALVLALVGFSLFNLSRHAGQPLNIQGGTGPSLIQAKAAMLPGEPEMREDIERRMSILNARKAAWDPPMREVFDSHLGKIDESLNHCRRNLLANPADQDHQQMVMALYEEKLRLLEDFDKLK